MPDFKRRYDEEMRHLQIAARRFARIQPEAARNLAIEDVAHRDPSAERLFQNFAFLAAKTMAHLEEMDEEVVGDILDLVAHGVETPLPALSMVEFHPRAQTAGIATLVARGAQVLASPSGAPHPMRMELFQDCPIHHLAMGPARFATGTDGMGRLEFSLSPIVAAGAKPWPAELEIFLGGSPDDAWALHHLLLRRVGEIRIESAPSRLEFLAPAARSCCSLGDAPSTRPLLALRDFLCSDDIFRFVRLRGLDQALDLGSGPVRIEVVFRGATPRNLESRIGEGSLRLNCAPVANAFQEEILSRPCDRNLSCLPLESREDPSREVLDLVRLRGSSRVDPTRTHGYIPAWSSPGRDREAGDHGTFRLLRQKNRAGGTRMSASIAFPSAGFPFGDELLSGEAWCCDGDAPHDLVRPANLCDPGPGIPAGLEFSGIMNPTRIFRPPDDPGYRWAILAHFHGPLSDLVDARRLKELLHRMSWDPAASCDALIEGIHGIDDIRERVLSGGICHHLRTIRLRWVEPDESIDALSRLGRLDAFAALLLDLFGSREPRTRLCLRLQAQPSGTILEHRN